MSNFFRFERKVETGTDLLCGCRSNKSGQLTDLMDQRRIHSTFFVVAKRTRAQVRPPEPKPTFRCEIFQMNFHFLPGSCLPPDCQQDEVWPFYFNFYFHLKKVTVKQADLTCPLAANVQ
jgi:hypothetical protein